MVNTIGHTKVVPGLYRHLDYPDVASLAMPSALLVINGSKDTLFEPEGVRAAFDKLTACYRKAGVPEKLSPAALRHPPRIQRRNAGRSLGLAETVGLRPTPEEYMEPVYRCEIIVPTDAVDRNRLVNNVAYLQWMQDAAMQHSAATVAPR